MSRQKFTVLGVLAAPIALYLILLALWAAFGRVGENEVAHAVKLAGVDISGKSRDELASSVADLTKRFSETAITIDMDGTDLSTTAGKLGLAIDSEATTKAAMKIGHNDPVAVAPIRWVKTFFSDRHVDVALDVDRDLAENELVSLEGDHRTSPIEPTMELNGERFELVNGVPGKELVLDELLTKLPSAAESIGDGIDVSISQVTTAPKIDDDAVQAVVDKANKIGTSKVTVRFGEEQFELDGATLRGGLSLDVKDDTPTLAIDDEPAKLQLVANLPIPANPTGVRFAIIGGVPTPVPGTDAEVCCTDDSGMAVINALLDGKTEVTLEPRKVTAAEGLEWAKTLGVKEVIGEYTTNYPCCQSRVTNIKRFSELTAGILIAPGETFSANQTVGRRTVEKGFVEGGVIKDGVMDKDIGGGVSQWATTAFNAAFFAGLDIPQHKPHSLYISRYPYGREATLSYPDVDLKIRNNTPYGVVIWPMAGNNGITVQMWSTRWVRGEQTAISRTSGCGAEGNVTVTRTRTYLDGRTEKDTFSHRYNCEIPDPPKAQNRPTATTTPTTAAPAPEAPAA